MGWGGEGGGRGRGCLGLWILGSEMRVGGGEGGAEGEQGVHRGTVLPVYVYVYFVITIFLKGLSHDSAKPLYCYTSIDRSRFKGVFGTIIIKVD